MLTQTQLSLLRAFQSSDTSLMINFSKTQYLKISIQNYGNFNRVSPLNLINISENELAEKAAKIPTKISFEFDKC